eukprot:1157263-Pelagomonas_calceolata.AAC.9
MGRPSIRLLTVGRGLEPNSTSWLCLSYGMPLYCACKLCFPRTHLSVKTGVMLALWPTFAEIFEQSCVFARGTQCPESVCSQVPYLLDLGEGPAAAVEISRASDFPLNRRVRAVLEPTVKATIVTPQRYVGKVMQLCLQHAHMSNMRLCLQHLNCSALIPAYQHNGIMWYNETCSELCTRVHCLDWWPGFPLVAAPATHVPEYATPGAHVPEYATPGAHVPEYATPGAHVPEDATPGAHVPEYATPGAHVPEYATPGAHVPKYATPGAHVPEYATPGAHVPEHATPGAHVLEYATPGAHVPEHAPHSTFDWCAL